MKTLCPRRRAAGRRAALVLLWIASHSASHSWAADDTERFADLEAALREHPTLLALTHDVDSSREQATAALALPDPVVALGINNFPAFDPAFDRYLPTNKAIGLRQQFPSRASRAARAGTAAAQADGAQAAYAAQLATLRGELIALLYERSRIAEQRAIVVDQRSRYESLASVVTAEIDAGRPMLFRLAAIEAERAELDRTLIELDGEHSIIALRLVELVATEPSLPPPPVAPIAWSGRDLEFHAVRVAAAAQALANRGIDVAKAAWKPHWGAELSYQQREAGRDGAGRAFDGDDWVSAMVTFTVPLWAESSQQPQLRAAAARQAAAEARQEAAARAARARYATLQTLYRTARANGKALGTKIRALEEQVSAQRIAYESAAGSYAPVIDGELTILQLRAELAAEQARSAIAAARQNALLVQP